MAECRHGIDQGSCADCSQPRVTPHADHPGQPDFGALWQAAHPDDGLGPWVTSRWDGTCRGCGERWEAGELIRYYAGEDGWLCGECGASPGG